ncbi:MAG: metallophosphoesterase [Chitinophagales bacterium]|nr:metallophosphoesterase [Chitinophagales bacterium]MDW8428232.1 metallophosphoesterase [Chitinophagales bacterium]
MMALLLTVALLLATDVYAYQSVATLLRGKRSWGKTIRAFYWLLALSGIAVPLVFYFYGWERLGSVWRNLMLSWMVIHYVPRIAVAGLMIMEDVYRLLRWLSEKVFPSKTNGPVSLSRKKFLSQLAVIGGGLLTVQFIYGMVRTAYDIRIVRQPLRLRGLPKAFQGLMVAQISDLHLGSFMSLKPVETMVEKLNELKPDVIFFTGDMVNNRSNEIFPYLSALKQIQAPLGVYAVRGNHDFGDYYNWPDEQHRKHDELALIDAYRQLGWRLLINEHALISRGDECIAVVGVDNWSVHKRFRRYGDLNKALKGTEQAAVRLLLSHDPTHWDAEILSAALPIAVTCSGHTHGFQFGVETAGVRWSPAQWLYPRWAGLYQQDDKYLYVNRGIGFVGYSGRVGIKPEITVFELLMV